MYQKNDAKVDAVTEAISILNSMGYKTLEIGWMILSGRIKIHIDTSNLDYEVGTIKVDGVTFTSYKL